MLRIALVLALVCLLLVGWCAVTAEISNGPGLADGWRRTADGWQHRADWSPGFDEPQLPHPLVVASLQMLVCTASLIALTPHSRSHQE